MTDEIQIVHVHLENPLIISDEFVQSLVIENPTEFYQIVCELSDAFEGKDGRFVFLRSGEEISADKYGTMICDPFHFDLNDRKILQLLYKKLEGNTNGGDYLQLYYETCGKISEFLTRLNESVPFLLTFDEPQVGDILKTAGVKFGKFYENLEEKIICYINALIELKNCQFFVFVNLKSVLDGEKLLSVYRHCQSEKVGLLLVESSVRESLSGEKTVIITEDLCEIVENNIGI